MAKAGFHSLCRTLSAEGQGQWSFRLGSPTRNDQCGCSSLPYHAFQRNRAEASPNQTAVRQSFLNFGFDSIVMDQRRCKLSPVRKDLATMDPSDLSKFTSAVEDGKLLLPEQLVPCHLKSETQAHPSQTGRGDRWTGHRWAERLERRVYQLDGRAAESIPAGRVTPSH